MKAVLAALLFAIALSGSFGVAHAAAMPSAQSALESLPVEPEMISGDKLLGAIAALREQVTPQVIGCGWKNGISELRLNLYAYKISVNIPGIGALETPIYTFEMSVDRAAWYLDIYPELGGASAYVVNSQFAHGVVLERFLEWLETNSPQAHSFITEGKGDCRAIAPGTAI